MELLNIYELKLLYNFIYIKNLSFIKMPSIKSKSIVL